MFSTEHGNSEDVEVFLHVALWSVWRDRNLWVFEGRKGDSGEMISTVGTVLGDYISLVLIH